MQVRQLIGPRAGQIIDLPAPAAQSCRDAGTVQDKDAPYATRGGKMIDPLAPEVAKDEKVKVEDGVPTELTEIAEDQSPLDDVIRFKTTEVDGVKTISVEGDWPKEAIINKIVFDDDDDSFPGTLEDGMLSIQVANGNALYRVVDDDGLLLATELVTGAITGGDNDLEIPEKWKNAPKAKRLDWAEQITKTPVDDIVEADKIIETHLQS